MATANELMVSALEAGGSLNDVETILHNTNTQADQLLADLGIQTATQGKAGVPVGADLTADLTAGPTPVAVMVGNALPGSMEETIVTAPRLTMPPIANTVGEGAALSTAISAQQQAITPGVPAIPQPSGEANIAMIEATMAASGDGMSGIANVATGIGLALDPALEKALREQDSNLEALYERLEANMAKGAAQTEALTEATAQRTKSKQVIALTADQANLKAQRNVIAVHEALGGPAADLDRASDQFDFEQKREELGTQITTQMSEEYTKVPIIDSVINSFRTMDERQALIAVNSEASMNIADTRAAAATMTNASQTALQTRKMITDATIVANQKVLAADGQIELFKANREQTQSNAVTYRTMAGLADSRVNSLLKVEQLRSTAAGQVIQADRHRLALKADLRAQDTFELNMRLGAITEERSALLLASEGRTMSAKEKIVFTDLAKKESDLRQAALQETFSMETIDARIGETNLAFERSKKALEVATFQLDNAKDLAPGQKELQQEQLASLRQDFQVTKEKREEWTDLKILREGNAANQFRLSSATATSAELQADAAVLMQAGKLQEAMAKMEEAARVQKSASQARVDNVRNVTGFQDFLLGPGNGFSPEQIEQGLEDGNPVVGLLRQLGAVSEATGHYALGAPRNYAQANRNLSLLEEAFPSSVDNTLPSVKTLRDIRMLAQKEWAANPASAEATGDEIAREQQFNRLSEEYLKASASDIKPDDRSNPYAPQPITSYIEQASGPDREPGGFADQPLTKLLIEEGQAEPNIPRVFEIGITNVQTGRLTLDQHVAGVVSLGQQIVLGNMQSHHGLAPMGAPTNTSVNMRMPKPRGFASSMLDQALSVFEEDPVGTTVGSMTAAGLGTAARIASTAGALITVPGSGAVAGSGVGILGSLGGAAAVTGGTALPILAAAGTAYAISQGLGALATNDYIVVNIADPVAVRAYSVDMMNSTSLGGGDVSTPAAVTGDTN